MRTVPNRAKIIKFASLFVELEWCFELSGTRIRFESSWCTVFWSSGCMYPYSQVGTIEIGLFVFGRSNRYTDVVRCFVDSRFKFVKVKVMMTN